MHARIGSPGPQHRHRLSGGLLESTFDLTLNRRFAIRRLALEPVIPRSIVGYSGANSHSPSPLLFQQFDLDDWRGITFALAQLIRASVAARARGVARRDLIEQALDHVRVIQGARRPAARRHGG